MVVPPLPPLLQAGIVVPRTALRFPGFLYPWSGFVQGAVTRRRKRHFWRGKRIRAGEGWESHCHPCCGTGTLVELTLFLYVLLNVGLSREELPVWTILYSNFDLILLPTSPSNTQPQPRGSDVQQNKVSLPKAEGVPGTSSSLCYQRS